MDISDQALGNEAVDNSIEPVSQSTLEEKVLTGVPLVDGDQQTNLRSAQVDGEGNHDDFLRKKGQET